MEFLQFEKFISIDVLIIFYYLGAIVIPIILFYGKQKLLKKIQILKTVYEKIKDNLSFKIKIYLVFFFLFLEIVWRVMFEFLIAFIQIRDKLVYPLS